MALRCDDGDKAAMVAAWLMILKYISSGDTLESENFLPITNCHIISSSQCSTFKAATCYLVDSTIIIQRPMEIFQVFLNKNNKEHLKVDRTSTRVDLKKKKEKKKT